MSGDGWKIPKHTDCCAGCGKDFEVGDLVTAWLVLDEEQPRREDHCASCGEEREPPAGAIYWRRKRSAGEVRKQVVDYTMLREVFSRLIGREEPEWQRLTYLVGLVLVRKRFLKLVGFEVRDGRHVMVVRRRVADPEMVVAAPLLSPEEIVATREHLVRLLDADLEDGALPDLSTEVDAVDEPADATQDDGNAEVDAEADAEVEAAATTDQPKADDASS